MAKGLNAKRTGRTINWTKCSECKQMVFASSITNGICISCHQAHAEVAETVIEVEEVETGYYNNTEPELQEASDDNWIV